MGNSAGTTKTTSTSSLPAFQQPYVEKVMGEAQNLYNAPGPLYFPDATVAPVNSTQQTGQSFLTGEAARQANINETQVTPGLETMLNAYKVQNNPVVADYAKAAIDPIQQALMKTVLPGIRSGSVMSGTLGGSRQALAEGSAIGNATREMGNTTAGIYNNAYNQGMASLAQGLQMSPALQQSGYMPGQVVSAVGDVQQQQQQKQIDAAMQKWAYEQALPYQKLVEFSNLINGQYGGQGSSEVKAEGSGTTQTIGSILAGLGLTPWLIDIFKGGKP